MLTFWGWIFRNTSLCLESLILLFIVRIQNCLYHPPLLHAIKFEHKIVILAKEPDDSGGVMVLQVERQSSELHPLL